MKRSLFGAVALAAAALSVVLIGAASGSTVTTANGTWTAYPGQSTVSQTAVQQPINTDGSSNFKANGKAVIPVKFGLSTGTGPLVFESIGSDTSTPNDYSYVSFDPTAPVTFNEITELSSVYAFTLGDCHGGSLRWQVRTSPTQTLFIYYGNPPQFGNGGTGGCTASSLGGINQSGSNLIGLSDLRYDTTQYPGGTFYDTYAHAQTLMGSLPITNTSLILDSGWGGDQRLTLTSATVKTAGFTDTFTPQPASDPAPTCNLPTDATIKITKTDGVPTGDVNEPLSIQPNDNNGIFRVVDCKLMYNLATSSLSGVGTYTVSAVINGTPASNPAVFDLK
jgi:hypothetical protein